jgi:predicted hotdog family 3-hydroxylacyl-ACP dehydratase
MKTMYDIETLIPHRNRMKLIDEIVEYGDDRCVTASVVTGEWPLVRDGGVNPIIIIELAAQTAGVSIGLKQKNAGKPMGEKQGWLVGVKSAEFFMDAIPVNEKIVTEIHAPKSGVSFVEVTGTSRVGQYIVGEVVVQIFLLDDNQEPGGAI